MSELSGKCWLVIMAGGSGTRFWPRSRALKPKQTLNIIEDKSLLQATVERFETSLKTENIIIITTKKLLSITKESLPEFKGEILCEPEGKNTAPCITMAMEWLRAKDPEAVAMVVPADHWISEVDAYLSVMRMASEVAATQNKLITVGITPSRAETGYGYIRCAEPLAEDDRVNAVDRFVEKPKREVAETMIQDPQYFWNAGMFIWSVGTFFTEMQKTNSALLDAFIDFRNGLVSGEADDGSSLRKSYEKAETISIDYALMEKSESVVVIPASFDWNDLGSFQSLYELYPDTEGGVGKAKQIMAIDSTNNLVDAPMKTVALLGVTNMMVIDTVDVILVAAKERSQDVKKFVARLKEEKDPDGLL